MDDLPYTTPDEDPFNVRHVVQVCPRPRKSSLFDKWIQEQRSYSDLPGHTRSHSSPLSNPYLAYPDIGRSSLDRPEAESQPTPESNLVGNNDLPQRLAADFTNIAVTDAPSTLRSSKHNQRMSFSPSSFRHFNLGFRSSNTQSKSDESSVPPSRPSSRLALFSRSIRYSGSATLGRATVTPQNTPQKRPRHASQISPRPPSPRKVSPIKIRPHTASSRWRPTVLGHFGPVEPAAPAASQTSIQPPPSDSNYTPSRPSLSSSVDASHTNTSLTVPSIETSSIHHSPISEKKDSPPRRNNTRPSTPAVQSPGGWSNIPSDAKRYSTPPVAPIPPPPHFHQQHIKGPSSFTPPAAALSLRAAHPRNTTTQIQDVFTAPTAGDRERETATPSPTHSSILLPLRPGTGNSTGGGTSPYGMAGPYPRMYPYVYHSGIKSQPSSISSRRGANAFDGIPGAWRYPSTSPNSGNGFEHDVDDVDEFATNGSGCSYALSAPQMHTLSSNQHYHHHHQPRQTHQRYQDQQQRMLEHEHDKKKKKADVVYTHSGGGGTLSKMTSFTNLNLANLSTMSMRGKKKKKRLIVSGVAAHDAKKLEGVKRWCESFGEVRQILRMPNGDLIISFQSAEVADTVCRIRAKVFINGVGSVQLSWTTEKKR